jgi:hypothetical protein
MLKTSIIDPLIFDFSLDMQMLLFLEQIIGDKIFNKNMSFWIEALQTQMRWFVFNLNPHYYWFKSIENKIDFFYNLWKLIKLHLFKHIKQIINSDLNQYIDTYCNREEFETEIKHPDEYFNHNSDKYHTFFLIDFLIDMQIDEITYKDFLEACKLVPCEFVEAMTKLKRISEKPEHNCKITCYFHDKKFRTLAIYTPLLKIILANKFFMEPIENYGFINDKFDTWIIDNTNHELERLNTLSHFIDYFDDFVLMFI